jgi:hypothetical protein
LSGLIGLEPGLLAQMASAGAMSLVRDRESDLGYGEIVLPEQTQRENKHSVKTNTA